jgi:hypothetical protein
MAITTAVTSNPTISILDGMLMSTLGVGIDPTLCASKDIIMHSESINIGDAAQDYQDLIDELERIIQERDREIRELRDEIARLNWMLDEQD